MKTNRSLFLSGFNEEEPLILHVVSRIAGRQFLLGDEEREVFVEMMRMYADFCEMKILSYCIMSNHFHILLEVPPKIEALELSDEEFIAKLSSIYSGAYVKEMKQLMQRLNKNQATKAMRELKAKYTYRIGSVSEFMKSLKQRFSRWFNKKHGRRGTLWEERYSATAVGAGDAARMVAAYIDLNPLRAGMVQDPKDYRWCSYAMAVAGAGGKVGQSARDGYAYLYQMSDMPGSVIEDLTPEKVLQRYRMLIAEEGEAVDQEGLPIAQGERKSKRFKRRRGYSRQEIEEILEKNGKLTRTEILRCKTRYFTDGAVIGSKAFVNGFFKNVKSSLAGDRQVGAKPMRRIQPVKSGKMAGGQIFSFRDLQKDVYGS